MDIPLRALIVEDSQDDADRIVHELRRGGYALTYERVENAHTMRDALASQEWDVIIADHSLPQFSGLEALRLTQESGLDLPFILVSNAIGEDAVVSALKAGVHDYLMKDNLTRLIPTVERELQEAEARRAHREAGEEASRRAKNMSIINDLALECAAIPSGANLYELLTEKLKAVTGAFAVSLSVYDDQTKELILRHLAVPGNILSTANKILGEGLFNLRVAVSPFVMHRMVTEMIMTTDDLSEMTFGTIPRPVAAIIQRTFNLGSSTGLALRYGDELVGSAVVMMRKDQAPLSPDLAQALAHVLTVSLRRKSAEDRLQASEERFRAMFENSPVGVYQTTPDGRLLMANPAMVRMLGFSSFDELASHNVKDHYPEDQFRSHFKQYVEQHDKVTGLESVLVKKDGSKLFVRENVRIVRDEAGNIAYYEGTAEDITEQVRTEQLLQVLNRAALATAKAPTLEDIFAALAEELKEIGLSCMILLTSPDRRRLLTSYVAHEAALAQTTEQLTDPKQKEFSFPIEEIDVYQEVVTERKTVYTENAEELMRQTVPEFAMEMAGTPANPPTISKAISAPLIVGDDVIGVFSVQSSDLMEDDMPAIVAFAHQLSATWYRAQLFSQAQREIIERERVEKEIRQHVRGLVLLNRIIATSAVTLEAKTLLEAACRELVEFFEIPHGLASLLHRDQEKLMTAAEYRAEGWNSTLSAESAAMWDDLLFVYLSGLQGPLIITDAQQDMLSGSDRSTTPDEKMTAHLHASLLNLLQKRGVRSLLSLPLTVEEKVVGNLILESDVPFAFSDQDVNLAMSATEQVTGALARIWLDEDHRRLSTAIEQANESVIVIDTERDIVYVNPAFEQLTGYKRAEVIGQNISVLESGKHEEGFSEKIQATIEAGKVWRGRIINRSKTGDLFTVDTVISPIRDENGRIVNYVEIQHDVTRELKLEEQYRQAQKMEAVGLLAGGIAHDFNNLLTAISGFAEMLQFRLLARDPARDWADKILATSQRAADLVQQLLAFSRKQIIQPKVLNLNDVVRGMENMLQRIIGEDISLQTTLEPELWLVEVDPIQIEQVILNLAINARDAMSEGGDLTIETANVVLDEEYTVGHLGSKSGEHVCLIVRDTGSGMSEEVKSRIFEPFFTTKEIGKGTGLGLATVYGIAQQSGGHIWVYSEEGMGTVFRFYLPCIKRVPQMKTEPSLVNGLPEGKETILLVEDAVAVQELAALVLRNQGFNVLIATNGEEALRLAQEYEDEIHLLFTDIIMPGMTGKDVAEQLTQARPGLKVLFTSGYADGVLARHGVLDRQTPFIEKPFTPHVLAHKVREVLDS